LLRVSAAHEATLFMTLLAAFHTLLHRYTGETDIVVGSAVANRTHAELEALIGCFVNTLPFRADLSGDPTFSELLARVREVALGAYAHQELPFELLVQRLHVARNPSYSPVFQTMFVLQNAPMPELALAGLAFEPVVLPSASSHFDLWLGVERGGQCLVATFEYNPDLFLHETIVELASHFGALLESIVQDPERPLSRLSILADDERRRVLTHSETSAALGARDP
jgi:non-ribosomal peptide synthetase component F